MVDEHLLSVLREKIPDVTEREAELFNHLWSVWPHIPPTLMHLESGERTASRINKWVEETYGLRFNKRADKRGDAT